MTIRQSRGLLTSDRKQGTTGAGQHCPSLRLAVLGSLIWTAVVWRVTPLFAEWIASPNFLSRAGYIGPSSVAIELGAGVSGIVALTLGPKIRKYIATDQDYVIRLLQQNISENLPKPPANESKKQRSKKKAPPAGAEQPSSVQTLKLDWELDSVLSLPSLLSEDASSQDCHGVDLVIACDCIYNDALIEPFNSTCAQICRLRSPIQHPVPTLCLVAQQLRSPDVFESWLKSFHRLFHVWKVPDNLLTEALRENSGFIVHIGLVR